MTGPAALLLALALGAEGRLDTGLRLEAQARRTHPALPADARAVDLSVSPSVSLDLRGGGGSATLAYAPTLTAADVGPDERSTVMHQGSLRLAYAPDTSLRLELLGAGARGRTDLITWTVAGGAAGGGGSSGTGGIGSSGGGAGGTGGAGGPGGTGPLTTIGTTQRVDLERLNAGATLRYAPTRRTELLAYGAYLLEGGTNAESRITNPVSRGAEASAELRVAATRLDAVGLRASGFVGRVAERRTDALWTSAIATWRHRLAPDAEVWSGAGAVYLRSRVPAGAARTTSEQIEPAAELGVARTAAAPAITGQIAGRLGATEDALTGVASPTFTLEADLRWPLGRAVALLAHGGGTLSWPRAGTTRTGVLRAGAQARLASWLSLEVAGFGTRQRSTAPGILPVDAYGALVSLSVEPPPLRF